MAKKAKRRGRPPGSKNKKRVLKNGTTTTMDVGQLRDYIGGLQTLLSKKIQQQKDILQGQLAELSGYGSSDAAGARRTATIAPRPGKRAKAKPKYQSKKKPSIKWSGRGMLPIWMREEMKGTKLKKDDFLIRA